METPKYPKGHPQVANVAINQAKNLAGNFHAMISGKELTSYEYTDLGSMATVGRNKAILINRAWNYFTKNSSLRIILRVDAKD